MSKPTPPLVLGSNGSFMEIRDIRDIRIVGVQHPFRENDQSYSSLGVHAHSSSCADCYKPWQDLCHEQGQKRLLPFSRYARDRTL